jgi:3-deoxy-D-manno-octulosonic acid (KDO) 8-phosphate synthase
MSASPRHNGCKHGIVTLAAEIGLTRVVLRERGVDASSESALVADIRAIEIMTNPTTGLSQ